MLRHWVNFGLLFSFLTLMGSGLLAYLRPFSIATTRVHLAFGLLTILLVLMHVFSRTQYFASKTKGPRASKGMIAIITVSWCGFFVLALWGVWPIAPLVDSSYEARHKRQIVRQSPLAGVAKIDKANQLVARLPDDGADTAVSLLLRFRDEGAPPPAMAIWAETTSGSLIETLYLDQELAYSENVKWQGVETQRHLLLPIWRHRHTLVSGVDPQGEIDAFTAATPSHAFTLDQYLKAGEQTRFVLCVEVNAVGDTNATYHDATIGQPSLLYTAYIDLNEVPSYRLLELTAHGGGAEKSGALQYDLEKIDSAKQLVDLLLAHVARVNH